MLSTSKCALCILLATPLFAALIAAGCTDDTKVIGGATGGHPPADGGESSSSSSSSSASSGGTGGVGGTGGSTGGTGGAGGAEGDAGPDAADAEPDAMDSSTVFPANCFNQFYGCGDGVDNDKDGLVDSLDPDCFGPCDNTEDGLAMGIPGSGPAPCKSDCFWDSDYGSGNDLCFWNHKCDPLSIPPNYYPESWMGSVCAYNPAAMTAGTTLTCDELSNQQSAECLALCAPLTPNGCDCFGCCVMYKDGVAYGPVYLNTEDGTGNYSCTLDDAGDPSKCAPCTQVKNGCNNPCETCELCLGKNTLPPECQSPAIDGGIDAGTDGGTLSAQCPDGVEPCGLPNQGLCAVGHYCITGCCIPTPK
jgi:hypothetical protein